jgi:hypothetical protein
MVEVVPKISSSGSSTYKSEPPLVESTCRGRCLSGGIVDPIGIVDFQIKPSLKKQINLKPSPTLVDSSAKTNNSNIEGTNGGSDLYVELPLLDIFGTTSIPGGSIQPDVLCRLLTFDCVSTQYGSKLTCAVSQLRHRTRNVFFLHAILTRTYIYVY